MDRSLKFIKLVSALFDQGIWARMSNGARALYPALLRFSNGDFKAVYPGTRTLMELTGFKHKKSIREARNELISLGLVTATRGNGSDNTYYQFRFDWVKGERGVSPGGRQGDPGVVYGESLVGIDGAAPGGLRQDLPHNQIHITITNNVQAESLASLRERFGENAITAAVSRCQGAGIPASPANVEQILADIPELARAKGMLSPDSLRIVQSCYLGESQGLQLFDEKMPAHLRKILSGQGERVKFVQSPEIKKAQA